MTRNDEVRGIPEPYDTETSESVELFDSRNEHNRKGIGSSFPQPHHESEFGGSESIRYITGD